MNHTTFCSSCFVHKLLSGFLCPVRVPCPVSFFFAFDIFHSAPSLITLKSYRASLYSRIASIEDIQLSRQVTNRASALKVSGMALRVSFFRHYTSQYVLVFRAKRFIQETLATRIDNVYVSLRGVTD